MRPGQSPGSPESYAAPMFKIDIEKPLKIDERLRSLISKSESSVTHYGAEMGWKKDKMPNSTG